MFLGTATASHNKDRQCYSSIGTLLFSFHPQLAKPLCMTETGLINMLALTSSLSSQSQLASLLGAPWYSWLMNWDSKKERIIIFQTVSFTYWSARGYIKIRRKGKWTLETHLKVSVQVKGSRQRLVATGKGKVCKRLKKVRKSLTILGNTSQRSCGGI